MKLYNFESHITVVTQDSDELLRFQKFCNTLGIKSITITGLGINVPDQVMTSHSFKASNKELAISISTRIMDLLEQNKFNVIRHKIETEPSYILDTNSEFMYAEIHVAVPTGLVTDIDIPNTLKSSSNTSKSHVTSYTFRSESKEATNNWKDWFVEVPRVFDFSIDPILIEYAILDSNPMLDKLWFDSNI